MLRWTFSATFFIFCFDIAYRNFFETCQYAVKEYLGHFVTSPDQLLMGGMEDFLSSSFPNLEVHSLRKNACKHHHSTGVNFNSKIPTPPIFFRKRKCRRKSPVARRRNVRAWSRPDRPCWPRPGELVLRSPPPDRHGRKTQRFKNSENSMKNGNDHNLQIGEKKSRNTTTG